MALSILALAGASGALAAESLRDDFAVFLDWFPGRYDNARQVMSQHAGDIPADERNYRRHSIFRRVDLPAFGAVVFYAEQYRDGDPSKIYRQRIYVLTLDDERAAIRLRVHIPNDVAAIRGAYRETSLLDALTPADTTTWPGCDVFWRRYGDRFEGSLEPGACQFDSPKYGRVQLEETLTLTKDALWFADRGLSMEGKYLFGMRSQTPAKALKARAYLCTGGEEREVWVHDQGGVTGLHSAAGKAMLLQRDASGKLLLFAMGDASTRIRVDALDSGLVAAASGKRIICARETASVFDDHQQLAPH